MDLEHFFTLHGSGTFTSEESSGENKSKSKPLQHELHCVDSGGYESYCYSYDYDGHTTVVVVVKLALHWVQHAVKDFDPKVKPVYLRCNYNINRQPGCIETSNSPAILTKSGSTTGTSKTTKQRYRGPHAHSGSQTRGLIFR